MIRKGMSFNCEIKGGKINLLEGKSKIDDGVKFIFHSSDQVRVYFNEVVPNLSEVLQNPNRESLAGMYANQLQKIISKHTGAVLEEVKIIKESLNEHGAVFQYKYKKAELDNSSNTKGFIAIS
ncbi:hypothetical protein [Flammeovirga agarivorans]|uniref:Uncharacterized protein n=1 Tax=Flammeovirga agarivorans TaxID=2726742 RepID=A0A7X8SR46_9BACT|nr:hypothetical protein [Flammeovirga agarivorans]NLR94858.1 hypothetical protein [Flammeovirga agarivorans]